ncbi:MAG: citrate synthase [Oscillospiraceae bacterium]|nr:citrate synthase [Oscillospiraceae bacterium]
MSINNFVRQEAIKILCEEFKKNNHIDPELYKKYDIKRGLRNADGTGVPAGLTLICNVHGFIISEGERVPMDGELIYRGIDVVDIVKDITKNKRFGFEETIYLLLFGDLPTADELDYFNQVLASYRDLPANFVEDVLLKTPSRDIMNKLASSVLSLYTYDNDPDNTSIESELCKSIEIIARMPNIMVNAYQAKRRAYDNESLFLHPVNPNESIAESILSALRPDRMYTEEEAQLLDLCLVLHAEHGGGNNSTFTCRVLTSSATDCYSAYAGAIGSLKGPRHGGANIKVIQMTELIKRDVENWTNADQVAEYLNKIMLKQAGDMSGLIYGMGHAVYTKSDPRAIILRKNAVELAEGTEYENEFKLLTIIEELAPGIIAAHKGDGKTVSANVDLYSGLVYKMLGIPEDLFTALFAVSRISGWSAHRMEEILTSKRIIRPAYRAISELRPYISLDAR